MVELFGVFVRFHLLLLHASRLLTYRQKSSHYHRLNHRRQEELEELSFGLSCYVVQRLPIELHWVLSNGYA